MLIKLKSIQGMVEYGQLLQNFYKKNTIPKETDVTAQYLSYWTDNGIGRSLKFFFKLFVFELNSTRRLLLLVDRTKYKLSDHTFGFG